MADEEEAAKSIAQQGADGSNDPDGGGSGGGGGCGGEEEEPPIRYSQWLFDRMFGKSPPPDSIPPSWFCYVPPCISIAPGLFEQNWFCERLGAIGVIDPDERKWRKRLMHIPAFFNVAAFALAIAACFAISTQFSILRKLPFSSGVLGLRNLRTGEQLGNVTCDVGLQAIAYSDPLVGNLVINFEEFCDYNSTGLENFILPPDCEACEEASAGLIFTLAVSAFPFIPSFFANIIRGYYNYDVNCLKAFGVLANAAGMAMSMYSYLGYRHRCFFSFYEGDVYYTANVTTVDKDSEEAVWAGKVRWNPGNALVCIIVASALVGVDIICHLLVPSPSIARDHDMQAEYERLNTNSEVTENVSCCDFIGAFCNMILGRKKQEAIPE